MTNHFTIAGNWEKTYPLKLSLLLGGAVINTAQDYKFNIRDLVLVYPVKAIVYGSYILNPDLLEISNISFKNSVTIHVVEEKRTLKAKYFPATKKIHVAGITTDNLTQLNNVVDAIIKLFPAHAHASIVSIFPISAKYRTQLISPLLADESATKRFIDLKSVFLEFEKEKNNLLDYRIQYNPERHSSLIIRKTNKYALYVFNSGVINVVSKHQADAVILLKELSYLIDPHIY
jgi:hypothetical protein